MEPFNTLVVSPLALSKVKNISFNGYISTWILRIYQWIFLHEYRYIGNKQKYLKFMEILCKIIKMTLIIKYTH